MAAIRNAILIVVLAPVITNRADAQIRLGTAVLAAGGGEMSEHCMDCLRDNRSVGDRPLGWHELRGNWRVLGRWRDDTRSGGCRGDRDA